ncbi:MAG: DNA-binding NarL/FixJ family response regulator [Brevundimonas sp.]|jgi:DNA-binding NarL/FixJ family response regulator|uniref:RNA polymerase sigma factor n=1 Tax=Brevundimonas sp. TaxID=1871086 RepID=UPI0039E4AA13
MIRLGPGRAAGSLQAQIWKSKTRNSVKATRARCRPQDDEEASPRALVHTIPKAVPGNAAVAPCHAEYLATACGVCFLQARRKRSAAEVDMDGDALDQRTSPSDAVELRLDVERATRQLSTTERIVLRHVVQPGLSHDEVACVLAMPLGTVKSHTKRGKAKLRALLADWQATSREELRK